MQDNQQGNVEKNPSKINRPGQGGAPAFNPAKPAEEDEAGFDSETDSSEINPGKLDREKTDDDWTGTDYSQGHEPYEFKGGSQGDRSLRKGYDESNFAVDSGAEGTGEETFDDESRGASLKKSGKGVLMGQTHAGLNGFGSSGTSGTNSRGHQGYQSGLGSAGSQNGSTGYNAGSQGMPEKIHPERPNKRVDINKLGRENRDEDKETRH